MLRCRCTKRDSLLLRNVMPSHFIASEGIARIMYIHLWRSQCLVIPLCPRQTQKNWVLSLR